MEVVLEHNEQTWITANENLRLIHYKLMYRMYYTTNLIHEFYSTTAESWLKCKTNKDSIIHAFRECYKVKKLWAKLECWQSEVLQY